ncbi:MAG: NADH-ubiquinone oxidoreductase-F iron-sulfur binding region domain-containing protein [Methylococcales bacterium]|nr:NADH-ubiquinone oxidoreductase-F iron-sulfur binding region domain-containing protein [Methylococcales bacterium]
MGIIEQIQAAKLTGKGGADFPVHIKWQGVMNAHSKYPDKPVYVICNATEGEPGIEKDKFILQNYPEKMLAGMKIAMETLGAVMGYIYLNPVYYKKFGAKLKKLIGKTPIEFFVEHGGYICGEETTLLETIESKRSEPRLKPPFPTERGLFSCPTLVNNVETFYHIAAIAGDNYRQTRFYFVGGDVKNSGVYELPVNLSIGKILEETKNLPSFEFFIQAGGGAAGEILTSNELNAPLKGAGSIIVYNLKNTKPLPLLKKWVEFFYKSNCGKCAPCREGFFRLRQLLNSRPLNIALLRALVQTMKDASFCPLGRSIFSLVVGLLEKIGLNNKR